MPPPETLLTRRRFLVLTAAISAAACTGRKPGDSAGAGAMDSGDSSLPKLDFSKLPYVQLLDAGARLRFETLEDRALPVTLTGPDGSRTVTPSLREDKLSYVWDYGVDWVEPDLPGLHVLQEVWIKDLQPGQLYSWVIDQGGGHLSTGSFRVPLAGTGLRLGWIADTMAPTSTLVAAKLAGTLPELVVHGGDLVYQTSPTDTWVGWFRAMARLTTVAPLAVAVGNHEFEDQDEISVMFDRLLMPQGDGAGAHFNTTRAGPVRLILIDTETSDVNQITWLESALAEAAADDSLSAIIVGMHRPMYTGSSEWLQDATQRDQWHALFLKYGVRLVLAGHVHGYEHWLVDDIHYVVDGGGGGLTTNLDEGLKDLAAARPDEPKLRLNAIRSYGATAIDLASDGSMTIQRLGIDAEGIQDSFSVPAG
ncbi:MAG: hypothetical protein GXP62_16265 [Oligoflexia bacterium]|nr:hypothetical protein [Oligoflexia bacterium]